MPNGNQLRNIDLVKKNDIFKPNNVSGAMQKKQDEFPREYSRIVFENALKMITKGK